MKKYDVPLNIEDQISLMKKYVVFVKKVRMNRFLLYTGYFRASRYGKFLLSYTSILGEKPKQDLLFNLYEFDVMLREVLMKYCKKAEIQFKSNLSNSISIKTGSSTFYLNENYYTSSKGENDKSKRNLNKKKYPKFIKDLKEKESKLRKNKLKYPELKEYRHGGTRSSYKIPSWAAFSYFDFGTIVMIYSYLKGDLRKEVLAYGYSKNRYDKAVTKEVDTWLDAIRNLRNVCAHNNILVGRTSSVVLFENIDTGLAGCKDTDLFSRLYALKKILKSEDIELLKKDLNAIIKKSKIDIYLFNILPRNWEELYDGINVL